MSLTRKTDRQARRFFNKTGSDIERAFSKKGPLAKIRYQVGGAFEEIGDDITDAGRVTLDGLKDAEIFLRRMPA